MQRFFAAVSLLLLSTLSFTLGNAPSAGACGPTSIANVPGCWGTPGCAYVKASDLGSGAACKFDYCNCGGTNVPLLPETLSGTTTIGCASYTLQPTANSCPTSAPTVSGGYTNGSSPLSLSVRSNVSLLPSVTAASTVSGGYTNGSSPSSSSARTNVSLPPGGTVVTATIGSSVLTQTFVPTTFSDFATLSSTITTTILGPSSSPVTIVIGPGGVGWTPLSLPPGIPEVAPPTVLPSTPKGPTNTSATSLPSRIRGSAPPPTTTPYTASQPSITGAFANTAQSETTIVAGGVTLHYSKATFSNLKTITAITTVTTPLPQTNKDGTHFTLTAATIIVGPHGVWWYGGTGGWGWKGLSCIWPFCPPGGGGDSGGGGSGGNPNDPDTPNSPEKPSDPDDDDDDDDNSSQQTSQQTSQQSSTLQPSTSSCISRTASDCSVLCFTPTGVSTAACSTTCTSTLRGCSATGTTITSFASGAACKKPEGWASVVNGDDFSDYQPLGTAGIAVPGGTTAAPPGAVNTGSPTSSIRSGNLTSPGSTTVDPPGAVNTDSLTSISRSINLTSVGIGSSSSSNGAAPTPPKTTQIPSCMADGAPWYSPTSWCGCGASATYPTLPASSGATSANCAYSSLPASQITPRSTSAAPTNIPGQGGVPGCAAVASVPGTSAYCNCGGTPASTLSPTTSGYINCDYTLQPTNSYNPAIPQSSEAAVPLPSAAIGQCNVHLWQGLGQEYSDPEVVIDVNITDASGTVIGYNSSKLNWGQGLGTDSELSDVLVVTPQTGIKSKRRLRRETLNERIATPPPTRPLFEHGPVDFALGSQTWDTSSPQCTVGGWDNGDANDFFGALIFGDDFIPNRQMECKFSCLEPQSKRSLASLTEDSLKDSQHFPRDPHDALSRNPTSTIERTPSPVDENLHILYARAHSAAWVKYAPSGARYYQAWKDKSGPDAVSQCNFDDDFDVKLPVRFVRPASYIRATLEAQGYSIGRAYFDVSAVGPKNAADGPFAHFTNTISASQGVFLANDLDRGALPADPNDPQYDPNFPDGRAPVSWRFSSVAWWMWKKTVLTVNRQWRDDPSQADYSGLKSFWHRQISNLETQEILDEAFEGKNIKAIQTWTPDDTDQDTNPFWALLGCPNGNGMQYILTDNKIAMKGKGILSISAVALFENGVHYTMWATYG